MINHNNFTKNKKLYEFKNQIKKIIDFYNRLYLKSKIIFMNIDANYPVNLEKFYKNINQIHNKKDNTRIINFQKNKNYSASYIIIYSEWKERYQGNLEIKVINSDVSSKIYKLRFHKFWLWLHGWRGAPRTIATFKLPSNPDRALIDLSQASSGLATAPLLMREVRPTLWTPPWPAALAPEARPQDRLKLSVAAVMDPFSHQSFAPEADFRPLSALDAAEDLEAAPPDLLLIESAWQGFDGSWRDRLIAPEDPALEALLKTARRLSVPVAFWNKEDPVHFKRMAAVSRRADAIFTTDADLLPAYRRMMGGPAGFLGFPVQPLLHNPVGRPEQGGRRVFFAGTYNNTRYPRRMRRLNALLQGALDYDLAIFDRMLARCDPQYWFPEAYHPYLAGSLDYPRVAWATRFFDVGLNVNTVERSSTMCSRRIVETLACGTHVVSSPSRGAEALFGPFIDVARTPEETRAALKVLLEPGADAELKRARMIRLAHRDYAARRQLRTIAEALGLSTPQKRDADLLVKLRGAEDWTRLARAMAALRDEPERLIALLAPEAPDLPENFPRSCAALRLTRGETEDPAETLRRLAQESADPGAAPFAVLAASPEALRPSRLTDAVNALRYAQADCVGPSAGEASREEDGFSSAWLAFRWSAAPRLSARSEPGGGLRIHGDVKTHALRRVWDAE